MILAPEKSSQRPPPSTRGRQKAFTIAAEPQNGIYKNNYVQLHYGDTLDCYDSWPSPTVIVSDGGYGVLGFDGDTTDHLSLPDWYEPHVKVWSERATPQTTLWF
jgi:site-specific DNA-methyltransferase (adenine-specific)